MIIADLPPATFAAPAGNVPAPASTESSESFLFLVQEQQITDIQPAEALPETAQAPVSAGAWDQLFSFSSLFFAAPAPVPPSETEAPADVVMEESAGEAQPQEIAIPEAGDDTDTAPSIAAPVQLPQQPVNTAHFGWSLPAEAPSERRQAAEVEATPMPDPETVATDPVAEAARPAEELAFAVRVTPSQASADKSEAPHKTEISKSNPGTESVRTAGVQPAQGRQVDAGASGGTHSDSAGAHSDSTGAHPAPEVKEAVKREEPVHLEQAQTPTHEPVTATAPAASHPHRQVSAPDIRTPELPAQPVEVPEVRAEQAQGPRDVSVRIAGAGDSSVDVRIMERGGELRVAVRSEHTELRETLRAELPDLRSRIDQQGFRTETWHPTQVAATVETTRSEQDFSGGPREQQQQQAPRDQHEQHRSRQPRPEWLEEIERQTAATA